MSSVRELVDLDIDNLKGRSALVGDPRRRTGWDARSSHSRHCVGCKKARAVREDQIRLESCMVGYNFIGLAIWKTIKWWSCKELGYRRESLELDGGSVCFGSGQGRR